MTSQGLTDLSSLLRTMQPTLKPEAFCFLTLPVVTSSLPILPPSIAVKMLFQEEEGWTVVATLDSLQQALEEASQAETKDEGSIDFEQLKKQIADGNGNRWKMLTLNVHSSLLAVGFIAAISARFKDRDVPSNVVAGYYHDHIFVPEDKAETAMDALAELIRGE